MNWSVHVGGQNNPLLIVNQAIAHLPLLLYLVEWSRIPPVSTKFRQQQRHTLMARIRPWLIQTCVATDIAVEPTVSPFVYAGSP